MMNQKTIKICSVSGGKDSTSLYSLMVEFFGRDFLAIFADTGNEHPVTVNYVKNLHHFTSGPEVVIVKADFTERLAKFGIEPSGEPFVDMAIWKARFPSSRAQFCTEHLKLAPILKYLEDNHPFDDWEMYTGIRKGESKRRADKYPEPFTTTDYFDCDLILPMLYETEESMFEELENKNIVPNPLYETGACRVGCYPCIHASKNDLNSLPEWAWEKLDRWENDSRWDKRLEKSERKKSSFFKFGTVPFRDDPKKYECYAPLIRQWAKTSRGGRQFNLFLSLQASDTPNCMSTWGVCE